MNIYIGNLSYQVKEDELQKVFEEYGTVVSAKIIMDKFSGKSKGFAFVEMENEEEGKLAIEELNGVELSGRQIIVNVAKPRKEENR